MDIFRETAGALTIPPLRWPVATLGTFDGVHLGHQRILRETIGWARSQSGESVVITFSTHPRTITSGLASGFITSITSLNHRLVLMERLGVDVAVVLDFDRKLAETPADVFAETYLCRMIGVRGVVVGYNNRFGKDRTGDANLLRRLGTRAGFEVREVEPVAVDGEVVSSSAIRNAIYRGELEAAAKMLGRPVSVMGTVVGGEHRGTRLGFPTANLDLHHEARPPAGVYAGWTDIDDRHYRVLISIGSQPTFHAPGSPEVVEVYLDGFQGNLYGRDLEVMFVQRLRGQLQFKSADELKQQIRDDIEHLRHQPLD